MDLGRRTDMVFSGRFESFAELWTHSLYLGDFEMVKSISEIGGIVDGISRGTRMDTT